MRSSEAPRTTRRVPVRGGREESSLGKLCSPRWRCRPARSQTTRAGEGRGTPPGLECPFGAWSVGPGRTDCKCRRSTLRVGGYSEYQLFHRRLVVRRHFKRYEPAGITQTIGRKSLRQRRRLSASRPLNRAKDSTVRSKSVHHSSTRPSGNSIATFSAGST